MNPVSAAKELCKQSGWTLRKMELHHILYICHMVHLGENGITKPLLDFFFLATPFGPVHEKVRRFLRHTECDAIPSYVFSKVPEVYGERTLLFFKEMAKQFPHGSSQKLLSIVTRKGGGWERNYVPSLNGLVISNRDILNEYEAFK